MSKRDAFGMANHVHGWRAALIGFALLTVLALYLEAMAAGYGFHPENAGSGIAAGAVGRGVLRVPLSKHHAETMCSAGGSAVASWPDPPHDMTVSLVLVPGGYRAVAGAGPCAPGCRDSCEGRVRWGLVDNYAFVPLAGGPKPRCWT